MRTEVVEDAARVFRRTALTPDSRRHDGTPTVQTRFESVHVAELAARKQLLYGQHFAVPTTIVIGRYGDAKALRLRNELTRLLRSGSHGLVDNDSDARLE